MQRLVTHGVIEKAAFKKSAIDTRSLQESIERATVILGFFTLDI